jgi:hypothetical protein
LIIDLYYLQQSPPASQIGEHIHADLVPIAPSIGGHMHILMSVDDKSDFVVGVPLPTKHSSAVNDGYGKLIAEFRSRNHPARHISTDDEATLRASKQYLASNLITSSLTPAGLHEKKIERTIQTIRAKVRSIRAHLPYVLPKQLDAEIYLAAISFFNITPTKNTGPQTPFQLFHGVKPKIPLHPFGTIGLGYFKRATDPDLRGEVCIFLGHGEDLRYVRVYLPTAARIYSTRKFVALPHQLPPSSWQLLPNPHVAVTPTVSAAPVEPPTTIPTTIPTLPTLAPDLAPLPTLPTPAPVSTPMPTFTPAMPHQLPTADPSAVPTAEPTVGPMRDQAGDVFVQPTEVITHPPTGSQHQEGDTTATVQPLASITQGIGPTRPSATQPTRKPRIKSSSTPSQPTTTRSGRTIQKPSRFSYVTMTSNDFRV